MRITSLIAALALAFGPLALAASSGECGGSAPDGLGNTVQCTCDQRPICGEEGDCKCSFDQDCKDNCAVQGTLADALGSDRLPAFTPEPSTSR